MVKKSVQYFAIFLKRSTGSGTEVCSINSALGISGSLLRWFSSYLLSRQQRVAGSSSSWSSINAGVPQGFIQHAGNFCTHLSTFSYLSLIET